MEFKFPVLIFLGWMFTILLADRVSAEPCDEQLLLIDYDKGIEKFCPNTNESTYLFTSSHENPIWRASIGPLSKGPTVVAFTGGRKIKRKVANFIQINSNNNNTTFLPTNTTIDLPSRVCGHDSDDSDHLPGDMAVDWTTGMVYILYGDCSKIIVYDLNRSLSATVYDAENGGISDIALFPQKGLLIWARSKWGENSSIRRAWMDGTGEQVLMEVERRSIGGLAVDYKTSLIYWTDRKRHEILRCDFEGNHRQKLNLSPQEYPSKITVLGNIIYWQEGKRPFHAIYRAHAEPETKQLVFNGTDFDDLQIIPIPNAAEDSVVVNPCANSSCAQICVQSANKTYACLCGDEYLLQSDRKSCKVRRQIFVSTSIGLLKVPIVTGNSNASSERALLLALNTSTSSHVQCDSWRGLIYWAEKGSRSTKIMLSGIDLPETSVETVLEWDHKHIRRPTEELDAFALDWRTSNLYMVFRGQRRILGCSSANNMNGTICAELFGNQVASSVGGLVMDPALGKMYWTEQDEANSAVVEGDMDGMSLKFFKKGGLQHPTSIAFDPDFQVYWVDPSRQRIEHVGLSGNKYRFFQSSTYADFEPLHITINEGRLYWVGMAGNNHSSEAIFASDLTEEGVPAKGSDWETVVHYLSGNFTGVNGMSTYDGKPQVRNWKNPCEDDHPCAGVCLLSGNDSFRCVCPIGSEPDSLDGASCLEPETPVIIYRSINNGTIVMKNGSMERLVSNGSGFPAAYDLVKNAILWYGGFECVHHYEQVSEYAASSEHKCHLNLHPQAVLDGNRTEILGANLSVEDDRRPSSFEYDWLGDNVYFLDVDAGVIEVCGRNGECNTVDTDTESTSDVRKIAVDPPAGHIYWINQDEDDPVGTTVFRGEMDFSGSVAILKRLNPREVLDLTVDHFSNLLFWVERVRLPDREGNFWGIFHSDMDGENVKLTIRLQKRPFRIQVVGDKLFWTAVGEKLVTSCDKVTANNLVTHALGNLDKKKPEFLIIASKPIRLEKDHCIPDALCSHMCIATPTGYMRCLCPDDYKLGPDGWTCECTGSKLCKVPKDETPMLKIVERSLDESLAVTDVFCPGNSFPCARKCLSIDKLCNGFPECPDFSDEGKRCNEVCVSNVGCLHNCTRSPNGPICLCPTDQRLAEDGKSCVLLRAAGWKWKVGLMVSGIVGLGLLVVIVLVTWKYRQTRRQLRDLTEQEVQEFLRGDPTAASNAPDGIDRALLLPYQHVLLPGDIIMDTGKVLGSGEFGIVYAGTCKSESVAIKTFKRSVEVEEFKVVLAELKIMAYLGDHEFVVKFVGAEISEMAKRKMLIVTELSPLGDLLRYLWKVGKVCLENEPCTYRNIASGDNGGVNFLTLCRWCEQIATGMEYLTEKQIVHGDLAARNVLVFEGHVLKVSDFGLSKQLYGCSQYQAKRQRKLPWKWAAIELIVSTEFSEGSDVWAFGVTAWEIFSLGHTPYKGMSFNQEFTQYLQAGNRLSKPEHASDEIYKILLECWNSERKRRPSFSQLKQFFNGLSDVSSDEVESQYIIAA